LQKQAGFFKIIFFIVYYLFPKFPATFGVAGEEEEY